ncbi:MAG TPA: response regulator [Chitinophagaceae bacterium]|jgi:DNA-binding response OmpR family regulator|nr:response regulator [Chitinophagaceae bacterium]HAN38965.1 response regulator [Chitinophagaceae bacterium]
MKVLISEDDRSIQKTIASHLDSMGLEVIVTSDGREALKVLQENVPDIVITDIVMPYTSGLELIGLIKSNISRTIPIMVLSAIDEEDTVMIAFKLGADDFITKPFELPELTVRVNRLLQMAKAKA